MEYGIDTTPDGMANTPVMDHIHRPDPLSAVSAAFARESASAAGLAPMGESPGELCPMWPGDSGEMMGTGSSPAAPAMYW